MKAFDALNNPSAPPPELIRTKLAFGTGFGAVTGLAFALATWGIDGYLLSQAHVFLPWLKLIIGMISYGFVGGLAGFITAKSESSLFSLLAWLGSGVFFSWLITLLPLQLTPIISAWFKPELKGFLAYSSLGELSVRFWIAMIWTLIFVFLIGVLQIPLVESAVFSVSLFGRIAPFVVGALIGIMSGTMADNINNQPLRNAALAMNNTIQFVVDHKGMDVDPAAARENRTSSLRKFQDQVTQTRLMAIGNYDVQLGEVEVMIMFEKLLLNCVILYGQPAFCEPIHP